MIWNKINNCGFDPSELYKPQYLNLRLNIAEEIMKSIGDHLGSIIYVSGPATGIDNYAEKFDEVVSFLESDFRFKNDTIINPMKIIDKYGDENDYILNAYISLYIIDFADCIVLDDRSDKWKQSKGVLMELTASYDTKNIISFKSLIEGGKKIVL